MPELGELAAGNVIDFCIMQLPDDLSELTYELVMRERIFLVGHRDHPMFQGMDSTIEHPIPFPDLHWLERERVVMLPEDWRLSRLLYNLVLRPSCGPAECAGDHQQRHRHQSAAEQMAFAFLQESGISRTPCLDRLACFTVGDPPLTCPMAVVYKKKGFLSPAARTFIDLTKEYYSRFDQTRG